MANFFAFLAHILHQCPHRIARGQNIVKPVAAIADNVQPFDGRRAGARRIGQEQHFAALLAIIQQGRVNAFKGPFAIM
ncbi:MAG: Uncharacterised protein [Alphaproteobacteria bacterium]|nr:MAG: Uncharacterised protein [Alphaproteobacteria bacterium]